MRLNARWPGRRDKLRWLSEQFAREGLSHGEVLDVATVRRSLSTLQLTLLLACLGACVGGLAAATVSGSVPALALGILSALVSGAFTAAMPQFFLVVSTDGIRLVRRLRRDGRRPLRAVFAHPSPSLESFPVRRARGGFELTIGPEAVLLSGDDYERLSAVADQQWPLTNRGPRSRFPEQPLLSDELPAVTRPAHPAPID